MTSLGDVLNHFDETIQEATATAVAEGVWNIPDVSDFWLLDICI